MCCCDGWSQREPNVSAVALHVDNPQLHSRAETFKHFFFCITKHQSEEAKHYAK